MNDKNFKESFDLLLEKSLTLSSDYYETLTELQDACFSNSEFKKELKLEQVQKKELINGLLKIFEIQCQQIAQEKALYFEGGNIYSRESGLVNRTMKFKFEEDGSQAICLIKDNQDDIFWYYQDEHAKYKKQLSCFIGFDKTDIKHPFGWEYFHADWTSLTYQTAIAILDGTMRAYIAKMIGEIKYCVITEVLH